MLDSGQWNWAVHAKLGLDLMAAIFCAALTILNMYGYAVLPLVTLSAGFFLATPPYVAFILWLRWMDTPQNLVRGEYVRQYPQFVKAAVNALLEVW